MNIDRLSIRRRPEGRPIMHQHWGKLLFMHWRIEASLLRPLIPKQLELDTFDGSAWIGIVPFTMWSIRASFLPPVPGTSAFHELNVRTYVHGKGVPGVWFFSLDAANRLAVWAARRIYHLPYFFARMALKQNENKISYSSERDDKHGPPAKFNCVWTTGKPLSTSAPESLEFFLTERYCLFSEHRRHIYVSYIHHQPWPLQAADVSTLDSRMVASLGLSEPDGVPHLGYAEELSVEIWPLKSFD